MHGNKYIYILKNGIVSFNKRKPLAALSVRNVLLLPFHRNMVHTNYTLGFKTNADRFKELLNT